MWNKRSHLRKLPFWVFWQQICRSYPLFGHQNISDEPYWFLVIFCRSISKQLAKYTLNAALFSYFFYTHTWLVGVFIVMKQVVPKAACIAWQFPSPLTSFRFEVLTENKFYKFMIKIVCLFRKKTRNLAMHWDEDFVEKVFEQKTFYCLLTSTSPQFQWHITTKFKIWVTIFHDVSVTIDINYSLVVTDLLP